MSSPSSSNVKKLNPSQPCTPVPSIRGPRVGVVVVGGNATGIGDSAAISRIATGGGSGGGINYSINSANPGAANLVSLTIPMFRPLSEGNGNGNGNTARECEPSKKLSWIGYKVMAKLNKDIDFWSMCEIKNIAMNNKTPQIEFEVFSIGQGGSTIPGVSEDRIKRLILFDVKLDLVDLNALLSVYNNYNAKSWIHNVFYAPGAANYAELLAGYGKIGLYLGIDGVDENGRVISLNLDSHGIDGNFLESIMVLSQLKTCSLMNNSISNTF